jgi:branched-chain amino acid aminotransferase
MIVWRNGEFCEFGAMIAPDDRGFLLGDGVFETLLVRNGAAAFVSMHIQRLNRGLDALGFGANFQTELFGPVLAELARRNAVGGDAACRITVTRGGGPRGLAPPQGDQARIDAVAALSAMPAAPERISLMVSNRIRLAGASTTSFKCIGAYAENMLAKADARAAGKDEAIMLNQYGRAACCSAANLFLILDGSVLTPPPAEGAMAGVVRSMIADAAKSLGVRYCEAPLAPEQLTRGALIVTNSLIGVVGADIDGAAAAAADIALAAKVQSAYTVRLGEEFRGRQMIG